MSKGFKWIAASLLVVGFIVVFIAEDSSQSSTEPGLTFDEYDSLVTAAVPMISPVELADYLMKQEHHYNLVDLQGPGADYQIPSSETHTFESFLNQKIAINETIIVYSESDAAAVQLYYLLTIRGYFKVRVLAGGVERWIEEILQPRHETIEVSRISYRQELSEFFGGRFYQTGIQPGFPKIVIEKTHKKHQGC